MRSSPALASGAEFDATRVPPATRQSQLSPDAPPARRSETADVGRQNKCTVPRRRNTTVTTSAERTGAHRERARRGIRKFTISASADHLRAIAEHGYEGAASIDQDFRSEAASLFVSDTVVCLDHTG